MATTGNSISVVNLVENENPTSMQSVEMNNDMLPNMDTDTIENLAPFNNMKGSYNNLYCDNLDEEVKTFQQNNAAANQMLENVYCNVSPAMQTQSNGKSNIESSTTNRMVDSLLTASDPNMHVYSNVSNAAVSDNEQITANAPTATTVEPLPPKNKFAPDSGPNNIESIISQTMLNQSSKLLSDNLNDLDLDDPTLVSGSIANTPNTSTMLKLKASDSSKFSSSKKSKAPSDGPNVSKKLFSTPTSPMDVMIDGESGADSFLRSLHNTTMIDTALDLDSIEDANIGIENVS